VRSKLKIAELAPIAAPVAPESGRSIEELVYLMTEELVRRGHDVTLFATGNSRTSATLHAIYEGGYEECDELWNWRFHEYMHAAEAFLQAREFDVIHSHNYEFSLPFSRLVVTPVVHTYHVMADPDIAQACDRVPNVHLVAISEYQASFTPLVKTAAVIHHGIDIDDLPFNPCPDDYLLYLGTVTPDKGPLQAIAVARKAGMRLILAGPYDSSFFPAFEGCLADDRVQYVGAVGAQERNRLLANAAALVYPLMAGEPFGLVLIEAMGCGTPVVALRRGAVPEIVDAGVTGYIADDLDGLVSCIPLALQLDRQTIRQVAAARFSYRLMVDAYERLFTSLAQPRGIRTP
jgi:glycosyltransferase involved in cell wall biosynthesis